MNVWQQCTTAAAAIADKKNCAGYELLEYFKKFLDNFFNLN